MILKHHKVEWIKQEPKLHGIFKQVEMAGRTCYFSYDKMTKESASAFTQRMIKSGHHGMLEHAAVYLKIDPKNLDPLEYSSVLIAEKYDKNPYSYIWYNNECVYITTNLRVLIENDWFDDDIKFISDKTEYHKDVYTLLVHTDRITGESFLRHRTIYQDEKALELAILHDTDFSYARQSTRYCDFRKDKFDNNVSFIIPTGLKSDYPEGMIINKEDSLEFLADKTWIKSCISSEDYYYQMLSEGYSKEDARYAISFSLYSPLVMTATKDNWIKFLKLRSDKSAHKDARYVANLILELIPELQWEK